MVCNWVIYYTLKTNILQVRNGLFGINKRGNIWEQHKFTLERAQTINILNWCFLSPKDFHGIMCIEILLSVFKGTIYLFGGDFHFHISHDTIKKPKRK